MRLVKAKISYYKIKKIIECFCVDVDATKTGKILKLNRNTINRYFNIFRNAVYKNQADDFKKFIGEIEKEFAGGTVK